MAKKQAQKKRNPNDATFRNVQALKRRINRLELRVSAIEEARASGMNIKADPDTNADPSTDLT